MTLDEVVIAQVQQLPENERQQLLVLIDAWIEQHRTIDASHIQQAMAAVQSTPTLPLMDIWPVTAGLAKAESSVSGSRRVMTASQSPYRLSLQMTHAG